MLGSKCIRCHPQRYPEVHPERAIYFSVRTQRFHVKHAPRLQVVCDVRAGDGM